MSERHNLYAADGRTLLAKNVTKMGAKRWVKKNTSVHPMFQLIVFKVDDWLAEINGTKVGWRYSIVYNY